MKPGLVIGVLLMPGLALGQIQDLATDYDGAQMYFASPLRLKGTADPGYLKLFRYVQSGTGGQFELFRELSPVIDPNTGNSYYLAERPSVSADGKTVAWTAFSACSGGSRCISYEHFSGVVSLATGGDQSLGGQLTLSADGTYAMSVKTGILDTAPELYNFAAGSAGRGNSFSFTSTVMTGYRSIGDERQAVANGGAVLLQDSSGAVVWKNGQVARLQFAGPPHEAGVSADGSMAVYTTLAGGAYALHSYAIPSGVDTTLAASAIQPYVTADGKLATYLAGGQLWMVQTNGTGARQLTNAPEGVTSHVISGNGLVAYAATQSSRLLKIDAGSGLVTELSAATPNLQILNGSVVPGALLEVGVSNSTSDPSIVGMNAPIVARTRYSVTLEVPWEAPSGSTIRLTVQSASAFEEVDERTVEPAQPVFLPGAMFHQNFSGRVTTGKPAAPGEVITFYMTGLGPVSPAIATGAVTPAGPAYTVQMPFSCTARIGQTPVPVEVLFAGLAPGTVGTEQVNLRVPGTSPPGDLILTCSVQEAIGTVQTFMDVPVGPVALARPLRRR